MDDSTLDFDALEALTDPAQVRALAEPLSALTRETEILLFMSPTCRVCPHQLRSVATVMLASPNVILDVVDASQEPELAARYEVRAVPTTVVDDELVMVGVVPPVELARRLIERQGPEAAGRVFAALVEAEQVADAAERLADGRAPADAFGRLWKEAVDDERRELLLRVAAEGLLYDPEGPARGVLEALSRSSERWVAEAAAAALEAAEE